MLQVDLDVEAAQSITDSAGFITKEDFMKFAKDRNLVDFNDRKDKDDTPKKEWAPQNKSSKVVKIIQKNREFFFTLQQSSTGLLCCCGGTVSPEPGPDRVELAFKRMDKNKDGFITWDEFNKVSLIHIIQMIKSMIVRIPATSLLIKLSVYSVAVTR